MIPCRGGPGGANHPTGWWDPAPVPLIELVDETFVVADPEVVARAVHDRGRWGQWWPGLTVTPFMDRGAKGIRWSASGERWTGSIELWLEPLRDGVLMHHYQRLDPVDGTTLSPRQVAREHARRAKHWKRHAFAFKDALESGRRPGTGVHPDGSRSRPDLPRMGG